MVETPKQSSYQTIFQTAIEGIPATLLDQVTVGEINLTESLLTPGLQTSIIVQNKTAKLTDKNLNDLKGKTLQIDATRPILAMMAGRNDSNPLFSTRQTIYRMSRRELMNYKIEQYVLDCCDPTLLTDASTWVSKSWACDTPSTVVREMFNQCLNVAFPPDVEESNYRRPYIAENIHPFQVITQQAEVAATTDGNDPSFVHYMTYQNDQDQIRTPTHHFRSLQNLAKAASSWSFVYNGKGKPDANYANPRDILKFSFPCDFDLLSDKLNQIASSHLFNVGDNQLSYQGTAQACGLSPYIKYTPDQEQQGCPIYDPSYLLKRKPRMGLLDQDKIAMRITVPFNPLLHVGEIIDVEFKDIFDDGNGAEAYFGTGSYMIVNLTHNIKLGGLGLSTMDCVAQTVAAGQATGTVSNYLGSNIQASDQAVREYYSDPTNVWNIGN